MDTPALLKLTAAVCLALAVLLGLGFWQLQRLEWKEGLIAKIEARTGREPITLEQAIARSKALPDPRYLPVEVQGRFDHAKERYLYAISLDGDPGWHVITPLTTTGGGIALIDRGFVPEALRDAKNRQLGQTQEAVTITGLIRMPERQALFIPDNDPAANQWFWRDLDGMVRSMFPGRTVDVAPFIIEAGDSTVPGGWPKGGQTRLQLPNNHLQYAVTWFALALCLVAIYGVYVLGALREKRS